MVGGFNLLDLWGILAVLLIVFLLNIVLLKLCFELYQVFFGMSILWFNLDD